MEKKLLSCCCEGGFVGLILSMLLVWGSVGAWAVPDQPPVGATDGAAPAVDLLNLDKPQPEELTPSEIARVASLAVTDSSKTRPVIALLDFETSTMDEGAAKAISQAIWARLKMRRDVAILPREQTRRWLISIDLHPFTPYRTDIEMATVAKALKVDYLIYGCVDYVGSTYLIDYSVFSAAQGLLVMQDAQLRRMDLDQMVADVGEVAQSIGDRIAVGGSGTVAEVGESPEASTGQIGHKKPEQTSKVRIRKATVVEKAESAPVVMKVVKAEDKSVATDESPEPAQESAIDTKSQETASIETKTEPESQADATVPTAPKATADPVREAFNKALALPKNSKERLAALKDVAGKDPQVLMYQRMLIDEYFRQGLYPECITACDQALLIKPDDSLLLTVQGAAQFELNQLVEARVAYEKAVNSDPKNWYARYNLAQTLTVLKLPEAAIAWRNYLEVAGDDPAQASYVEEARRNLAQLAENSLK